MAGLLARLGLISTRDSIATADLDDNGVTLAKLAGGTAGEVYAIDLNGDPVLIPPGAWGQFLVSQDAGATPKFQLRRHGFQLQAANISIAGTTTIVTAAALNLTGRARPSDVVILGLARVSNGAGVTRTPTLNIQRDSVTQHTSDAFSVLAGEQGTVWVAHRDAALAAGSYVYRMQGFGGSDTTAIYSAILVFDLGENP